MKRIISALLVVAMLFTSLPVSAVADSYDPNAGQGGQTGNIGAGSFSTAYQGLRVSIYSGNELLEALGDNAVIDFWYDAPPPDGAVNLSEGANKLGDKTSGHASETIKQVDNIKGLPYPITAETVEGSTVFISHGDEIRKYLLGDDAYANYGSNSSSTSIAGFSGSTSTSGTNSTVTVVSMADEAETAEEKQIVLSKLLKLDLKYLDSLYNKERTKISLDFESALPPTLLIHKIQTVVEELADEAEKIANFSDSQISSFSTSLAEKENELLDKAFFEYEPKYEARKEQLVIQTSLTGKSITDELVPMSDEVNDGGVRITEFLKAAYSGLIDGETLAKTLNADPNIIVMLEPLVYYKPVNRDYSQSFELSYGTALNWAELNIEKAGLFGNTIGGGMALLSNSGLPRSMVTVEPDTVLGINPPSDTGVNYIPSDSLADDSLGWGCHIYSKLNSSGTHTWDNVTFPDGTPGAAPSSIPNDSSTAEKELLKESYTANIVKFYESNETPESNFTREFTPQTILIQDEPIYSVTEWFISPTKALPVDSSTSYNSTKSNCNVSLSGTSAGVVSVILPNTTLYVKLSKLDSKVVELQDFRLNESELTKAFNNRTVYGQPLWNYLQEWNWTGDSLEPGRSDYYSFRLTDKSLKFFVKLLSYSGACVAGTSTGVFAPVDLYGVNATRTDKYGTSPFDIKNLLHFVVYRNEDKPTLAQFRMSSSDSIKTLFPKYANVPIAAGRDNDRTNYLSSISMIIGQGISDISTAASYKYKVTYTKRDGSPGTRTKTGHTSSTHETSSFSFSGILQTLIYHRKPDMTKTGNFNMTGTDGLYNTVTGYDGYSTLNTYGFRVPTEPLKFYPYVRMSYQKAGQYSSKNDAYVLSEAPSILKPNDYVEAGWVSESYGASLKLKSEQWSTWARACRQDDDDNPGVVVRPWAGKNQVLPGGAIYSITTEGTTCIAAIGTYQTIVPDVKSNGSSVELRTLFEEQGTNLGSEINDSYTVANAQTQHKNLVETTEHVLDTLKIVQWVNANPEAEYAWSDGNNVKAYSAVNGVGLGALGLPNRSRPDSKYYLKPDTTGGSYGANEGDIDIISKNAMAIVYKVSSDTSGNIYLQRQKVSAENSKYIVSASEINEAIKDLAGDYPSSSDRVLRKDEGVGNLGGEAKELNDKTFIIKNLLSCLERDTGDDKSASWASDGGWYNEAIDGVYIVRQITSFKLGIAKPNERIASLDPSLCPAHYSRGGIFTRAHLSQFRLDNESDCYKGMGSGYVGNFKGQSVVMAKMENMLRSEKFWIPSASGQDLTGN